MAFFSYNLFLEGKNKALLELIFVKFTVFTHDKLN